MEAKQLLTISSGFFAILSVIFYLQTAYKYESTFDQIASTDFNRDSYLTSSHLLVDEQIAPERTSGSVLSSYNKLSDGSLLTKSKMSVDTIANFETSDDGDVKYKSEESFNEQLVSTTIQPIILESSISTSYYEFEKYIQVDDKTRLEETLGSTSVSIKETRSYVGTTNKLKESLNFSKINNVSNEMCYVDVFRNKTRVCKPKCKAGTDTFALFGMKSCRPFLNCKQIDEDVRKVEKIDNGTVKIISLANWKNYSVAILTLRDSQYAEDFLSGLEVLKLFSGSDHILQLIGYCEQTFTYVTEYHQFQNAFNFFKLLDSEKQLRVYDTVEFRFGLCVNYVQTIAFLHDNPWGTRVMCDANDIGKLLQQYLVTNQLGLVIGDVDAVPLVDQHFVCGKRMLRGNLLAPEQVWKFDHQDFSKEKQRPYNEKIDIWRIPDVCEYFLGNDVRSESIRYQLFNIHKQCKSTNSSMRPPAREVVRIYENLSRVLNGKK